MEKICIKNMGVQHSFEKMKLCFFLKNFSRYFMCLRTKRSLKVLNVERSACLIDDNMN